MIVEFCKDLVFKIPNIVEKMNNKLLINRISKMKITIKIQVKQEYSQLNCLLFRLPSFD